MINSNQYKVVGRKIDIHQGIANANKAWATDATGKSVLIDAVPSDANIILRAGVPDNTVGVNGDYWKDKDAGQGTYATYGPKVNDLYPTEPLYDLVPTSEPYIDVPVLSDVGAFTIPTTALDGPAALAIYTPSVGTLLSTDLIHGFKGTVRVIDNGINVDLPLVIADGEKTGFYIHSADNLTATTSAFTVTPSTDFNDGVTEGGFSRGVHFEIKNNKLYVKQFGISHNVAWRPTSPDISVTILDSAGVDVVTTTAGNWGTVANNQVTDSPKVYKYATDSERVTLIASGILTEGDEVIVIEAGLQTEYVQGATELIKRETAVKDTKNIPVWEKDKAYAAGEEFIVSSPLVNSPTVDGSTLTANKVKIANYPTTTTSGDALDVAEIAKIQLQVTPSTLNVYDDQGNDYQSVSGISFGEGFVVNPQGSGDISIDYSDKVVQTLIGNYTPSATLPDATKITGAGNYYRVSATNGVQDVPFVGVKLEVNDEVVARTADPTIATDWYVRKAVIDQPQMGFLDFDQNVANYTQYALTTAKIIDEIADGKIRNKGRAITAAVITGVPFDTVRDGDTFVVADPVTKIDSLYHFDSRAMVADMVAGDLRPDDAAATNTQGVWTKFRVGDTNAANTMLLLGDNLRVTLIQASEHLGESNKLITKVASDTQDATLGHIKLAFADVTKFSVSDGVGGVITDYSNDTDVVPADLYSVYKNGSLLVFESLTDRAKIPQEPNAYISLTDGIGITLTNSNQGMPVTEWINIVDNRAIMKANSLDTLAFIQQVAPATTSVSYSTEIGGARKTIGTESIPVGTYIVYMSGTVLRADLIASDGGPEYTPNSYVSGAKSLKLATNNTVNGTTKLPEWLKETSDHTAICSTDGIETNTTLNADFGTTSVQVASEIGDNRTVFTGTLPRGVYRTRISGTTLLLEIMSGGTGGVEYAVVNGTTSSTENDGGNFSSTFNVPAGKSLISWTFVIDANGSGEIGPGWVNEQNLKYDLIMRAQSGSTRTLDGYYRSGGTRLRSRPYRLTLIWQ